MFFKIIIAKLPKHNYNCKYCARSCYGWGVRMRKWQTSIRGVVFHDIQNILEENG